MSYKTPPHKPQILNLKCYFFPWDQRCVRKDSASHHVHKATWVWIHNPHGLRHALDMCFNFHICIRYSFKFFTLTLKEKTYTWILRNHLILSSTERACIYLLSLTTKYWLICWWWLFLILAQSWNAMIAGHTAAILSLSSRVAQAQGSESAEGTVRPGTPSAVSNRLRARVKSGREHFLKLWQIKERETNSFPNQS